MPGGVLRRVVSYHRGLEDKTESQRICSAEHSDVCQPERHPHAPALPSWAPKCFPSLRESVRTVSVERGGLQAVNICGAVPIALAQV